MNVVSKNLLQVIEKIKPQLLTITELQASEKLYNDSGRSKKFWVI